MLHYFKKEVFLSMIAALIMGSVSFYLFHFTLDQALGSSLLVLILFMVLLPVYGQTSSVEENDSAALSSEEYTLLEKKFKYVSEKSEMLELEKKTTEMFLASMSHEIRTPLNGIIGLTEVLDGTPLTQEQKEFVFMIRESSNNLRVIVNDVLDVSKMNAGKMELESIAFDLFRKLEASVGIFTPQIEEKNITFNLFTDPEIPGHILGDPTRLSQVIINLVSNAVKFTPEGGSITLSVDHLEHSDESVTFKISVSDSGIGLTQEQQEKIFEAYSQAEASTARKAGGTGLGLTISRKIVKAMGGELSVQSAEGEGATFFFVLTLPTVKQEDEEKSLETVAEVTAVPEESREETSKKKSFNDLQILVAEDNPINQKLIKIVLERFGLTVTLAGNGEEAYDARVNGNFDMIFMDIQMPVMGGIESTHNILSYEKEQGVPHIPIIALTANALPGDREKYIAEGMDDYATKPLDVKILEKLINQYCHLEDNALI